jgi:hypothetical protein
MVVDMKQPPGGDFDVNWLSPSYYVMNQYAGLLFGAFMSRSLWKPEES